MSKQTQIALDFGPEEQSPPPAPAENGGKVEETSRPYMAAAGVGVRIKSYKQTPAPQPGDLFEEPATAIAPPASAEPETIEPIKSTVNQPVTRPTSEQQPDIPQIAVEQSSVPETAPTQPTTPQEAPAFEESPAFEEAPSWVPEPREPQAPVTAEVKEPAVKAKRPAAKPAKQGPSKRGRKSLKQVAAEADLIEIPTDEVLFRKQYYTMGEVSEMFRVNQSLLRFWETEFDILQPKKNKKGDRYFRPIDIKNLHLIYHLLRQKKYTIEGAKEFLKKNKKAENRFEIIQRLQEIKSFLQEMKAQLG